MYKTIKICVAALILFNFTACINDNPGDNHGSNSNNSNTDYYTENRVTLSSIVSTPSNSAIARAQSSDSTVNCTYISDIYSASGTCITPLNVIGYAQQAHLLKENSNIGGGTRILGASEYDSTPGAIFEGHVFDLGNPNALVTNNTLLDQYNEREQYDTLTLSTAYYKIKFPVTINSDTKFVTMLLAKYGQPFSSSDAITNAVSNCNLNSADTSYSRYQDADLLPGLIFKRGDYLFCVKDNEADSCATTDYQWLDTANSTLTSTRPNAPKVSHWLANTAVACSSEGQGRVNFDFGPFGFYAAIDTTSQFKLWSDFSHGEYSKQWTDTTVPMADDSLTSNPNIAWVSPYYLYYYTNCGNGTCDSTPQQGTELDVALAFDTTQMILVEDLDTQAITAQSNIGVVLNKTHVKSQWAFDQKSINSVVGYDGNDMIGLSLTPTITVSGSVATVPDAAITRCSEVETTNQPGDSCTNQ